MDTKTKKIASIIFTAHPDWVEDFGESYLMDQVGAAVSGSNDTPPRAEGAEETWVGMIVGDIVAITALILNIYNIVDKIEARKDKIEAIRRKISSLDRKDKEALINALIDDLD